MGKHKREYEEASSLGIILCTGKKREQIKLLEQDKSDIDVAAYLTSFATACRVGRTIAPGDQTGRLEAKKRALNEES